MTHAWARTKRAGLVASALVALASGCGGTVMASPSECGTARKALAGALAVLNATGQRTGDYAYGFDAAAAELDARVLVVRQPDLRAVLRETAREYRRIAAAKRAGRALDTGRVRELYEAVDRTCPRPR